MLNKISVGIGLLVTSLSALAANTLIEMKTSKGDIQIELFNEQAPITTKNFEDYVKSNFYKGTVFHRVIPGFMIQGGGMDAELVEKATRPAIRNEATNGLKNERGTLAMARTNAPHSASSQFFINVKDNDFLNASFNNAGYAVFGRVTKGMDVVDKISNVPTGRYKGHSDVPLQPIVIKSVTIKKMEAGKDKK